MRSPAADMEVDEALLRALLEEQHPDLAEAPLRQLAAGWDNTLWRVGDELLARLPRREVAARLTVDEQRWLPVLQAELPLPVPVPVRVGRPSAAYPWSWSIVRWVDGTPGDQVATFGADEVARQVGAFLHALHRPAPDEAPHNPFRGVALAERTATFEERLAALAAEVDAPSLREVWNAALDAEPWTEPPVWIHGDLHPANLLFAEGRLVAVLDFGDLCAGDPATDLAAVAMLLPRTAIPEFERVYHRDDRALRARAHGWSVLFGTMLLGIGLDDRPTYEPIGRRTLATVVDEFRAGR